MATTYYVRARISDDGFFADCSYFYDQAGTDPVEGSVLSIPPGDRSCSIAQADGSDLVLLGASYKTLGHAPVMSDSNFAAADAQKELAVPMPSAPVTKGVVLLFSNSGSVEALYASADPEITNDPKR